MGLLDISSFYSLHPPPFSTFMQAMRKPNPYQFYKLTSFNFCPPLFLIIVPANYQALGHDHGVDALN